MRDKGIRGAMIGLGLCIFAVAHAGPPPAAVQGYMDAVVRNHPFLGSETKSVEAVAGGYQGEDEGGMVYFDDSAPSATSEVHGEVLAKYRLCGGPAGSLGFPRTSQMVAAYGVGQYNHFANGSIYWFPLLGAHLVRGPVRDKWFELGGERGVLGYPRSDGEEVNRGQACPFQYGTITYVPRCGAHYLCGAVLQKWLDNGGAAGHLGFPKEDPYTINDVQYQRFENGTLAAADWSRDLRTEIARRGISIRNQGPRGTCSIFAMTFLLEYAYTEMLGSGYEDLSEEFLNHVANVAVGKTDDGDLFSSAAAGYDNFGTVPEAMLPYRANWTYDFNTVTLAPQMYSMGQTLVQNGLRLRGHFVVPLGEAGASQEQFDAVLSYLNKGIPVAIGRGHSMAAVGYQVDPSWDGGGFLVLRNSYGPTADEAGYRRESFASVKGTVNDAYVYEQPYRMDGTPPGELVFHLKLDDASGTTAADATGTGHDGQLQGGPTWTTGRIGGGLSLDGKDDFVDLGNPPDLPSGRAARSLCAWARTVTTAAGWRWIVAYGTGGVGQAMFIGMNGTSLFGGGYADDLSSGGIWTAGAWHHVCLTYDGTTARLYADGVEVTSAAKAWDLVLNRAVIGRQVNDASEFWSGTVDDIRLYRRALPPNDVKAIVQGQPVPDDQAIAAMAE